jgi:cellulose synthase operon protein C
MLGHNRAAKINIIVLVILIGVVLGLGTSLYFAREASRRRMTQKALSTGQAAFEKGDWPAAVKYLNRYIKKQPEDMEALRQYAQAAMSVRPMSTNTINRAISAYNRLAKLLPSEVSNYERLAVLYQMIGRFKDLASIAQARLTHEPNDLRAGLWLAYAQLGMRKPDEAISTLQSLVQKAEGLPEEADVYVQACIKMSQLATGGDETQTNAEDAVQERDPSGTPLDWLNRAIANVPNSVEAQVSRAQYYSEGHREPSLSEPERRRLAQQDLESAEALGTEDPKLLLMMATQWLRLDELDKATAELRKANKLSQEKLEESFLDLDIWLVGRYFLATEIARKKGDIEGACALADEILDSLEAKSNRAGVLPTTIQVYVLGGKPGKSRNCLEEYLELVKAQQGEMASAEQLAALQALVAGVEGEPEAVIQALEPVVGNGTEGPELWHMMAEAYIKTNQTKSAIHALQQYVRLDPQNVLAKAELAHLYAKMGDWENAYKTQEDAESLGYQDIKGKLLRAGAEINLSVTQGPDMNVNRLQRLSDELSELRRLYPQQVEIRILQAAIANARGAPQEAEEALKQAIEECQTPIEAELQLAKHYQYTRRLPEAITLGREICQRYPDRVQGWVALSTLYDANQDHASARDCLAQGRAALTEVHGQRALSTRLALLELAHGTRETGIKLLWELVENDPQDIQARRYLLGLREIQADPETAQNLIIELRAAEGENGVLWQLHQAALWLASDQWVSKQVHIKEMLEHCWHSDFTWSAPVLLLAEMYTKMGDTRQVKEAYEQAFKKNPSATVIAEKLLTLLERQNRFREAEEILKAMAGARISSVWRVRIALGSGDISRAIHELTLQVSNNEQNVESRIQLAQLLYQESGAADGAFELLQEAEAIDPNSRSLIAVKACILNAEGKREEAFKLLDDYVAKRQGFAAYWMRAVFLNENGETDRAEQDFQRLLTFHEQGDAGYEILSNFYLETNRPEQAMTTAEEGFQAYPESLRLERRLIHLLLQRGTEGDQARATEILTELERALPGDTELMMLRAQCLLQSMTPESVSAARQKLENAVRRDPVAVPAYLMLVDIALHERRFQEANNLVMLGLGCNPDNPTLLLAWARVKMALGHSAVAADLALRVLRQDIKNTAAFALGLEASTKDNNISCLKEMLGFFYTGIEHDLKNSDLWIARARILAALSRTAEAILELEAYCQVEQGSEDISALTVLADLYQRTGDLQKSNEHIQRAEQLAPRHQAVVHARLMWLIAQNRLEELLQISSTYIGTEEEKLARVLSAARALMMLDVEACKAEAVKLFRHARSLAPMSSDACLGLASSLCRTGDPRGAIRIYEEWLDRQPNNPRALNDLAWILQEQFQRYDEALELINSALDIEPADVYLLDTRGMILMKLEGRLEEARRDFEKIQRLTGAGQPGQASNLLKLGRVCFKLNDFGQARQHLERALALDQGLKLLTQEQDQEIAGMLGRIKEEEKKSGASGGLISGARGM